MTPIAPSSPSPRGFASWLHAVAVAIVLAPVHLYRLVVSPWKRTPACRYLPTCSEYAVTAVRERGIFVGGALAAARIARCNPLFSGGYDPVPMSSGSGRTCCEEHS